MGSKYQILIENKNGSPALLLVSSAPNELNPVFVNALRVQPLPTMSGVMQTQLSKSETSLHPSNPNNISPDSPIHNIGGKLLVEGLMQGRQEGGWTVEDSHQVFFFTLASGDQVAQPWLMTILPAKMSTKVSYLTLNTELSI